MWQEQLHIEEVVLHIVEAVLHIVEAVLQVHKVRKYVKHGLFGHYILLRKQILIILYFLYSPSIQIIVVGHVTMIIINESTLQLL